MHNKSKTKIAFFTQYIVILHKVERHLEENAGK